MRSLSKRVVVLLFATMALASGVAQAAHRDDFRISKNPAGNPLVYVNGNSANELYLALDPRGVEDGVSKYVMLNPPKSDGTGPTCVMMNSTNGLHDMFSAEKLPPARAKLFHSFIASVLDGSLAYTLVVQCTGGLTGSPSCVMYSMSPTAADKLSN